MLHTSMRPILLILRTCINTFICICIYAYIWIYMPVYIYIFTYILGYTHCVHTYTSYAVGRLHVSSSSFNKLQQLNIDGRRKAVCMYTSCAPVYDINLGVNRPSRRTDRHTDDNDRETETQCLFSGGRLDWCGRDLDGPVVHVLYMHGASSCFANTHRTLNQWPTDPVYAYTCLYLSNSLSIYASCRPTTVCLSDYFTRLLQRNVYIAEE